MIKPYIQRTFGSAFSMGTTLLIMLKNKRYFKNDKKLKKFDKKSKKSPICLMRGQIVFALNERRSK